MSKAITYWWRKYEVLREVKREYLRKSKGLSGGELESLNKDYLDKLLDAVQ